MEEYPFEAMNARHDEITKAIASAYYSTEDECVLTFSHCDLCGCEYIVTLADFCVNVHADEDNKCLWCDKDEDISGLELTEAGELAAH